MVIAQCRIWARLVVTTAMLGLMVFDSTRPASAAGVIYVDRTASGTNNGTSWANAYKSLQKALSVAGSGDQIWVAKGIYKPTNLTNRTASFDLKNDVRVYGGFAGTETALSQRNPAANLTILSGEIGSTSDPTDNSYHVVRALGLNGTAVLDGFTIRAGYANRPLVPDNRGGGLYNENGSPTLRNLTFRNNHANFGGGLFNEGSSEPVLRRILFAGNTAFNGGGMNNNNGAAPKLRDVSFEGNTATSYGGGMHNYLSDPSLTNVAFSGNTTAGYGGAIYNSASDPTLTNVTAYNNSASYGGGMSNDSSNPKLKHVTFSGNSAMTNGGGMYNIGATLPTVENSVFWNNGSEIINVITFINITDSIVQGANPTDCTCTNVSHSDPQLGPLQKNGGFTRTMALGQGSAAIDAGGVNATCSATDQRNVSRPQGLGCDEGAYEVKAAVFKSTGEQDGWIRAVGEFVSEGGTRNSSAATIRLGDDDANRQYLGILSFNTSSLPTGALAVSATVRVKLQGVVGTNPLVTHAPLILDMTTPFFGTAVGLQAADFQAVPDFTNAGTVGGTLVTGWYSGEIGSAALAAVSDSATTQVRLRFTLSDNNDMGADYLNLYSGDASSANQPQLIVYYNP